MKKLSSTFNIMIRSPTPKKRKLHISFRVNLWSKFKQINPEMNSKSFRCIIQKMNKMNSKRSPKFSTHQFQKLTPIWVLTSTSSTLKTATCLNLQVKINSSLASRTLFPSALNSKRAPQHQLDSSSLSLEILSLAAKLITTLLYQQKPLLKRDTSILK